MATLRRPPADRNSKSANLSAKSAAIIPASDRGEIIAAAWASLGYVASKEGSRDDLIDGAAYSVNLTITGEIDGTPIAEHIDGRLTVGHATEKASSSTPNISHIIGCLLSKLNKATRAKVLSEIPAEYAAGGQALPELSVGDVADAENLLAALRQTKRINARGAVKCEYEVESVEYDGPAMENTEDPAAEAAKLAIFGLDGE